MNLDRNRAVAAYHIARHIEALCKTASPGPLRLVKGSPTDVAAGIVKVWGTTSIDVFNYLAEQDEPKTKNQVAKATKHSPSAVDSAWSRTIAACAILVHVGDSTEPVKYRLFPSGQSRMRGQEGVRLRLSKEQIQFSQLRGFEESSKPVVAEAVEHLTGVSAQIEEHAEKGAQVVSITKKREQLSIVGKTGTAAE